MTENTAFDRTMMNAALAYAERGWHVFPVHYIEKGRCSCGRKCNSPGKHPATRHGLTDATVDPRRISLWWTNDPKYNIGIATGSISGIWVLDIDARRSVEIGDGIVISEGESSLTRIEQEAGIEIPSTLTQHTGGGGLHLVFAYPEHGSGPGDDGYRNRASIFPSIDIRGDGGYILAAPSTHASGVRYQWAEPDHPLAPAPVGILGVTLRHSDEGELLVGDGFTRQGQVEEGGRNQYLYKYACSLRGAGEDRSTITERVFALNREDCKPPLDNGEVLSIVNSAMKHQPNPKEPDFVWEDPRPHEEPIPALADGAISLLSMGELFADTDDTITPLVWGGLMDLGDGAILAGPPNVGKSWLAFDLALAVASGGKWLDFFPTTQGPVIILDEEGSRRAMKKRMKKLAEGRGLDPYDLPVFMGIQKGIRLDSKAGVITVQRMVENIKPSLVIMDSLVRFHRGNENSSQEMSAFFERATKIKQAYDCTVLFLHHINKYGKLEENFDMGDLLRGSTDIRGWPDSIIGAMPGKGMDATSLKVEHIKSREHEKLPNFNVGVKIDRSVAKPMVVRDDRDALEHYVKEQQLELRLGSEDDQED